MSEFDWYAEGIDSSVSPEEIKTPPKPPQGSYVGSIEEAEISYPKEGETDVKGNKKYPTLKVNLKIVEALTEGLEPKLYKDRNVTSFFYLSPVKHGNWPTGLTRAFVTICSILKVTPKEIEEKKVPFDVLASKLAGGATKKFVTFKYKDGKPTKDGTIYRNADQLEPTEAPESVLEAEAIPTDWV